MSADYSRHEVGPARHVPDDGFAEDALHEQAERDIDLALDTYGADVLEESVGYDRAFEMLADLLRTNDYNNDDHTPASLRQLFIDELREGRARYLRSE